MTKQQQTLIIVTITILNFLGLKKENHVVENTIKQLGKISKQASSSNISDNMAILSLLRDSWVVESSLT